MNAKQVDEMVRLEAALQSVFQNPTLHLVFQSIAQQACELVDGIFSYVVQPNKTNTYLNFVSAWSRHHHSEFLSEIRNIVKGFDLVDPSRNLLERQGITSLVFSRSLIEGSGTPELIDDYRELCGRPPRIQALKEATDAYMRFVYTYPDTNGKKREIHTATDLAVPIMDGHQVLGVINVEHHHPYAISQDSVRMIERFAEFAAIAIRNHSAQERVKRLFEASNVATLHTQEDENSDDMLSNIAEKMISASEASWSEVYAYRDGKLIFITRTAELDQEGYKPGARANGHTMWAVKHGYPVVIPDVREYDPDFHDIYNRNYFGDTKFIDLNTQTGLSKQRARVCLPMKLQDRVIGAIWLYYPTIHQFTDEEITELNLYVQRASIAYDNEEIRELYRIGVQIGAETEMTPVLNHIIEFVTRRFGVIGAAIYLADHEKHLLTRVASNLGGLV